MRLRMRFRLRYLSNARSFVGNKVAYHEMSLRSLTDIASQIEETYARWERFEISTGVVIRLLQTLVAECRRVVVFSCRRRR